MNFVLKSLNSLVKLQQTFRIAEIEVGMENTIGITLETCVGVQSAILHVCRCFHPDVDLHCCLMLSVFGVVVAADLCELKCVLSCHSSVLCCCRTVILSMFGWNCLCFLPSLL